MEDKRAVFDKDYFENGVATGKSLYTNFRWLPEMTIKFVHKIIKLLNLRETDKVLDYGCAKGFMVKAFRLLDIDAYGCDISEYAISNADPEVKSFCRLSDSSAIPFENVDFNWVVCKDVLEHLNESEVQTFLEDAYKKSNNLFVIVPLGINDKYIIPSYALDSTHILAKDREWWEAKFESAGWGLKSFSYAIKGMKDNWAQFDKGNGFFILSKN